MKKNILRLSIILLVVIVLIGIIFFMKSNNLINIFNIGFKNKQNEETLIVLNKEKDSYSEENSGIETIQGFCDYLLEKQIVANEEVTENNGVKQIVVSSYIFNVNQVDDSTIEIIDTGVQLPYITYENFKRKNQTTGSATLVIEDDSEIEKIECPAIGESKAIIINANGSKKVSKDYQNIILNKVYIFKITTVSGEVKEKRFKAVNVIENVIYTTDDFQTAYNNALAGDTIYVGGPIQIDFHLEKSLKIIGVNNLGEINSKVIIKSDTTFENINFTGPYIDNVGITIDFKKCKFNFTGYDNGSDDFMAGIFASSFTYNVVDYFYNCEFISNASRKFASYAYGTPKAYIARSCEPYELSDFSKFTFDSRAVWEFNTIDLLDYSWSELSAVANVISQDNLITKDTEEVNKTVGGKNYKLCVGDRTKIVYDKVEYEVRILGFNHDDLADGTGKAGISFETVDCIERHRMNATATNVQGWGATEMREYLNGSTYVHAQNADWGLSNEVGIINSFNNKNYIKDVIKEYKARNIATVSTCTDKLWLLSDMEVNGGTSLSTYEGQVYKYYSKNSSLEAKTKKNGGYYWFLRSIYYYYDSSFLYAYSYNSNTSGNADDNEYFSFGFSI